MIVWSSQVSSVNILILTKIVTERIVQLKNWVIQIWRSLCMTFLTFHFQQEHNFLWHTRQGMHLAYLQFTPSCVSMGQGAVCGNCAVFCTCLSHDSFWLSAIGSATSIERALLIALLGLFWAIPTDSSIEWFQWQTRLTSGRLLEKKRTHFRSPTRRLIPPVFISFFKPVCLILSRRHLLDCV